MTNEQARIQNLEIAFKELMGIHHEMLPPAYQSHSNQVMQDWFALAQELGSNIEYSDFICPEQVADSQ